jgi:hypothetical protein
LQDCRIAGLQKGLQDCRIAGLQNCRIAEGIAGLQKGLQDLQAEGRIGLKKVNAV